MQCSVLLAGIYPFPTTHVFSQDIVSALLYDNPCDFESGRFVGTESLWGYLPFMRIGYMNDTNYALDLSKILGYKCFWEVSR